MKIIIKCLKQILLRKEKVLLLESSEKMHITAQYNISLQTMQLAFVEELSWADECVLWPTIVLTVKLFSADRRWWNRGHTFSLRYTDVREKFVHAHFRWWLCFTFTGWNTRYRDGHSWPACDYQSDREPTADSDRSHVMINYEIKPKILMKSQVIKYIFGYHHNIFFLILLVLLSLGFA